jgi:hypothetical protein
MKPFLISFFSLFIILYFSSCEKNSAKEFTGNFYFKTQLLTYGTILKDTTMYYNGTIKENSKTSLTVEYLPGQTLQVTVDSHGNLSNPNWQTNAPYRSFQGVFHDNGDVDIYIQEHELGGGYNKKIYGTKM